jgi:hypothetical protein
MGFPTVLIGVVGMGKPVMVTPDVPGAAFAEAAKSGKALVCKGNCKACGKI